MNREMIKGLKAIEKQMLSEQKKAIKENRKLMILMMAELREDTHTLIETLVVKKVLELKNNGKI